MEDCGEVINETIPLSNVIVYSLSNKDKTKIAQVVQSEPGERDVIFGHAQYFRDLISVHQVSENLFLQQIRYLGGIEHESFNNKNWRTYWSLMTLGG